MGSEKYKAPEILFSPDKIGLEWPGIHEMCINSIKNCDIDVRKTLYGKLVVAGGCSLLTGFNERLLKQMQKLANRDVTIQILAPKNRSIKGQMRYANSCDSKNVLIIGKNELEKKYLVLKLVQAKSLIHQKEELKY